jgi:hypothetical protein
MVLITKRFKTYVSLKNLGLSLKKFHCSLGKLFFSLRNNMSLRRRNLSCHEKQLNFFFLEEKEPKLPQGIIKFFFPQKKGA